MRKPGPKVIKPFPCSNSFSTKCQPFIKAKMLEDKDMSVFKLLNVVIQSAFKI